MSPGRLVVPRSSILIFRRQVVKRRLLRRVASYICGGEEKQHMHHIWHLIRKSADQYQESGSADFVEDNNVDGWVDL